MRLDDYEALSRTLSRVMLRLCPLVILILARIRGASIWNSCFIAALYKATWNVLRPCLFCLLLCNHISRWVSISLSVIAPLCGRWF